MKKTENEQATTKLNVEYGIKDTLSIDKKYDVNIENNTLILERQAYSHSMRDWHIDRIEIPLEEIMNYIKKDIISFIDEIKNKANKL